ncbi:MAG: nucleotidyltransferase family protein [Eubacterium sp.]|nr:nucleotidyltransferase family protein [Eubacterium sp.]
MTKEQKYFLELVRSHLNNEIPPAPPENIDFEGLFKVSEIQNMTAIVAIELTKLPAECRLSKENFSPFNQARGVTLQNYEYKMQGINLLTEALCKNGIKHLFLKGAAVREFYPVPEVRTSGDTDVVVAFSELEKASKLLVKQGFEPKHMKLDEHVFKFCGEDYEMQSYIKSFGDAGNKFFADTFDENKCDTENELTYTLKPLYHLVYIVTHILNHLKSGGAGVRQLADVDVIIRNCGIDIDEFFKICKEIGIEKSSKVIVALCKLFFDTPVDFDYEIESELLELMQSVILDGGTFGYGIGNVGTVRLMRTAGDDSKTSSAKAVIGLFKFDKDYLYKTYEYARKRPILLPVAYVSRLYDAVFKRGKQNMKHIKSMFTDREVASKMNEMLRELEIN